MMMEVYDIFFYALILHLIGDYLVQTEFMARNKGKYNIIMAVHSILYTFVFYLFLDFFGYHMPWQLFWVLTIIHGVIDKIKCNITESEINDSKEIQTKYLYIDQSIHYIIAVILLYATLGIK